MNDYLLKQVESMLEEMRANMIQSAKEKGLDWVKSEKKIAGVVESNFFVHGNYVVAEIMNKLGIGKEQANQLFGQAKANIYDKYSKL